MNLLKEAQKSEGEQGVARGGIKRKKECKLRKPNKGGGGGNETKVDKKK